MLIYARSSEKVIIDVEKLRMVRMTWMPSWAHAYMPNPPANQCDHMTQNATRSLSGLCRAQGGFEASIGNSCLEMRCTNRCHTSPSWGTIHLQIHTLIHTCGQIIFANPIPKELSRISSH